MRFANQSPEMHAKLGILAGQGQLPRQLIDACRQSRRPFFVLAFQDQTDPETVEGTEHAWIRLGAAGEGLNLLSAAGVRQLVMAGAIRKPSLPSLKPDQRTRQFLKRLAWGSLGDDGLLRLVIRELEEEGFGVVGAHEILSEILAPHGVLGQVAPASGVDEDLALGARAAMALGFADTGQAVVVGGGRIIGTEDHYGTRALIEAVAEPGAILVKMGKPQQERRADLPTIGPETVAQCAAAGYAGIAVEAGNALILERERTIAAADAAGLFILGIDPPQEDCSTWPRFFMVAGEASGDLLGGRLMAQLRELTGGRAIFHGVGGELMIGQGLRSLFPMSELSLMGLAEILPHLPALIHRLRQTRKTVLEIMPTALITIDAPGFTMRLARSLKNQNLKLIHYVAPSVWAWKPRRAKKIAGFLDHLLALFPFEPPYFIQEGLACSFVGHPVTESGIDRGDAARAGKLFNIDQEQTLLCLLPGSRRGEADRLLPVFRQTVEQLRHSFPDLVCAIPLAQSLRSMVEEMTHDWPTPLHLAEGATTKADIFARADVALAASGTVSLELAVAGTPNVIAYRMNPLTAWLARRLVKAKFFCLVNILRGHLVIPEHFQHDCRAEILAADLKSLLNSPERRDTQKKEMAKAVQSLTVEGHSPSDAAARAVLETIDYAAEQRGDQI